MPFSATKSHSEEYWKLHFEKYLKPIIEQSSKCQAFRSKALRGAITNEIILSLIKSDIVIADLTDHNPNVFWELGIRHSFKEGTIAIAQKDTYIPFDIKDKGVLFYDEGHLDDSFKDDLLKAIQDCCKHPDKPDNPVLETIGGRGSLYYIINKEETARRVNALFNETIYNSAGIDTIYETIESNKEESNEWRFPTKNMMYASIDLLLTNRYLDQPDLIYLKIMKYSSELKAINTRINGWPNDIENTENWFIRHKKSLIEEFQELEKIITNIKIELEKKE